MRIAGIVVGILCLLCALTHNGLAQVVSSTDLVMNAKELDGTEVTYQGEVIGDIMRRGEYAWINVNDGDNAIGIWIRTDLTAAIAHTGSYKYKGDRVEVAGIFNRACSEHGGDLDIHAHALRVVELGVPQPERISSAKKNAAALSIGVLGLVWILSRLKRK